MVALYHASYTHPMHPPRRKNECDAGNKPLTPVSIPGASLVLCQPQQHNRASAPATVSLYRHAPAHIGCTPLHTKGHQPNKAGVCSASRGLAPGDQMGQQRASSRDTRARGMCRHTHTHSPALRHSTQNACAACSQGRASTKSCFHGAPALLAANNTYHRQPCTLLSTHTALLSSLLLLGLLKQEDATDVSQSAQPATRFVVSLIPGSISLSCQKTGWSS
jgi:hypothetical protein